MNKNLSLEGFRGFLCVWVILFHYTTRFDILYGKSSLYSFENGGNCGVCAFLMISGYLLAASLLKDRINSINWFIKKIIRLYPAYWCAVTITFFSLKIWGLPNLEISFQDYVLNMLLFFHPGIQYVDGAYWYISVLLIAYILFAIFSYFKMNTNIIILFVLTLILILIQLVSNSDIPMNQIVAKFAGVTYCLKLFPLFVGYLTYLVLHGYRDKYYLSLLIFNLFMTFINVHYFYVPIIYLLFIVIIVNNNRFNFVNSFFLFKPFAFIGSISYSWYLIHQRIGYQIMLEGYSVMVAIIVTFILAYIIHKIESVVSIFLKKIV